MTFAETQRWLEQLIAGDEAALAVTAGEAGYAEPAKTATNLALLQEVLETPKLVISLARQALTTADPDLALNNLERLSGTVKMERLAKVLNDPTPANQLLTILGASPFLSGILCRRASFFENLFIQGLINNTKTEGQMCTELRWLIADDADTATMKKGLRIFKRQEMLRIGGRDLCGLAELEEVTAELSALAATTLQRAFEVCSIQLQAEYGRPLLDPEEERPGEEESSKEAEFTVLGMGKFGGNELNEIVIPPAGLSRQRRPVQDRPPVQLAHGPGEHRLLDERAL